MSKLKAYIAYQLDFLGYLLLGAVIAFVLLFLKHCGMSTGEAACITVFLCFFIGLPVIFALVDTEKGEEEFNRVLRVVFWRRKHE